MSAKDSAKRLVVHDVTEARPILPRSITLASSSLNPTSFRKEFKNTVYRSMPLEHAVDPKAEDRAMKDVAVPERYRLASNALFDDKGLPVIPLIRSHFVKEGLRQKKTIFFFSLSLSLVFFSCLYRTPYR